MVYSVTPQHCPNNCLLPLPPVPLGLARALPPADKDAPWLVLIGGNGAGYEYSQGDWMALAQGLAAISRRFGVRWLLTTSRRSGVEAESILRDNLANEIVLEAVYYGTTPRPVVREFLSRCQGVLVTEDSLTMVAEAIYSGRPVATLRPRHSSPEGNDALALERYETLGLINRLELSALSRLENLPKNQDIRTPDVAALIWESVKDFLERRDGDGL